MESQKQEKITAFEQLLWLVAIVFGVGPMIEIICNWPTL